MNKYIRLLSFGIFFLTVFAAPVQLMAQKQQHPSISDEALVKQLPGFKNAYATVNGIRLHYVTGGTGKVLVLLSGWPQTWWSFHKMMPALR